jgi:uracil-DNA glycosylase
MLSSDLLADRELAVSALAWWRDAGLETLVADEPRDWLAKPAPAAPTPAQPATPTPEAPLPETLDALLAWLRDSPDAPEAGWGGARLLPAGDPASGLMILTDVPEIGDAQAGTLIAGELGALFDRMLKAIGRDRGSIWLAPFATVRPVGGLPAPALPHLTALVRHQIGLVVPRRVLLMGDAPNRALLGAEAARLRGRLHAINLGDRTIEAVATIHPRLLLQRPTLKAEAWKDLQLLMKGL